MLLFVCLLLAIAFPSCRHILLAMGFFAFINIYCLRVNLSVALVAMVDSEYIKQLNAESYNVNSNLTTVEEVCEATSDNTTHNATDVSVSEFCSIVLKIRNFIVF